jgi:hypothetical protein
MSELNYIQYLDFKLSVSLVDTREIKLRSRRCPVYYIHRDFNHLILTLHRD